MSKEIRGRGRLILVKGQREDDWAGDFRQLKAPEEAGMLKKLTAEELLYRYTNGLLLFMCYFIVIVVWIGRLIGRHFHSQVTDFLDIEFPPLMSLALNEFVVLPFLCLALVALASPAFFKNKLAVILMRTGLLSVEVIGFAIFCVGLVEPPIS